MKITGYYFILRSMEITNKCSMNDPEIQRLAETLHQLLRVFQSNVYKFLIFANIEVVYYHFNSYSKCNSHTGGAPILSLADSD